MRVTVFSCVDERFSHGSIEGVCRLMSHVWEVIGNHDSNVRAKGHLAASCDVI
jgi:hypothetical protein